MTRFPIIAGVVFLSIALSGCEQVRQAGAGLAVYQTVTNPAVPVQDKACSVIAWGAPIAQQRIAAGTLTPLQISLADGAARAAQAYCRGTDLSWKARAVAAADELVLVLWDLVR